MHTGLTLQPYNVYNLAEYFFFYSRAVTICSQRIRRRDKTRTCIVSIVRVQKLNSAIPRSTQRRSRGLQGGAIEKKYRRRQSRCLFLCTSLDCQRKSFLGDFKSALNSMNIFVSRRVCITYFAKCRIRARRDNNTRRI